MVSLFLLIALQAATPPVPPPPGEWGSLPFVAVNTVTVEDSGTIMRLAVQRPECRVGIGARSNRMEGLEIDLALLIAPDGRLLETVAATGPCDAIRRQARALVNARYRNGTRRPDGTAPAWYRTRLGISWSS